jgi:hypothetical protein
MQEIELYIKNILQDHKYGINSIRKHPPIHEQIENTDPQQQTAKFPTFTYAVKEMKRFTKLST